MANATLMEGDHIAATDVRPLRAIPLSYEQRTLLERVSLFVDSSNDVCHDDIGPRSCLETTNVLH
jgi:hypothetical protein